MGFSPLSLNLYEGLAFGFFFTVLLATLLNRFGDVMFRWGVAKPFYIRNHRVHHRTFLFVFLPAAYGLLVLLLQLGVVRIVGRYLWTGLASTFLIGAACLTLDLLWDHQSLWRARWGILHHEFIYVAIPLYAFSNFLRIVV